jgi:hypothetical protein
MGTDTILCPSAPCKEGAILLGIVDQEGYVNLAKEKFHITSDFVKVANQGSTPESRFRFADKCQNKQCKQWLNGQCGVASLAIDLFKSTSDANNIQACSIRNECRWFLQSGLNACAVCPHVITKSK